jgi:nucleoside-specific outer membrane channel protein Tsx
MKITHLLAAGLMVAGLGVSATAASAQDYRHDDHRGHRGWHQHCHMEYRHHHQVRVCR